MSCSGQPCDNEEPLDCPSWACSRWGQYEHDWLDCDQCIANYDKYHEQYFLSEVRPMSQLLDQERLLEDGEI